VDDCWLVNGQKVWTSLAHQARWAVLLARTDPDVPKHAGLTYFVLDMQSSGVEVRPLRQMTGQAQFNEVFLTDARISDEHRLGRVGEGWQVARSTLMDERVSLGDRISARNSGVIGEALSCWKEHPDRQTPVLRHRLAELWARAEAHRLTCQRARVATASGASGPEGSLAKLVGSELNQAVYEFCMELLGPAASLYRSYEVFDVESEDAPPTQQQFLRSRASTIEGGTSEIQRNIIAERVLGLPAEPNLDRARPWSEVPRS
jgi:alkylation response protein AidB-like acyl-CoA dehydrogenase